jgi:hypothetical protein
LVAGPPLEIAIVLAADRAHLMDVKGGEVVPPEVPLVAIDDRRFVIAERQPADANDDRDAEVAARVEVEGPAPTVVAGGLRWSADPGPGRAWTLTLTITPSVRDGDDAGLVTAVRGPKTLTVCFLVPPPSPPSSRRPLRWWWSDATTGGSVRSPGRSPTWRPCALRSAVSGTPPRERRGSWRCSAVTRC